MNHFLGSTQFVQPKELHEVMALVAELSLRQQPYFFFSGGTDLVPYLKNYPEQKGTLISLSRVNELRGMRMNSKQTFEIGAQTKLVELIESPLIRQHLPGLALAAAQVASGQIRNQATLGGNLLVNNRCTYFNQSSLNRSYHDECFKSGGEVCHVIANAKRGDAPLCRARFVSDLAPVLLALQARLTLLGPKGKRTISLDEFYLPDGIHRNQLAPGELLCGLEISTEPRRKVAYEKLRIRNAIDFPSLGVAVAWIGEGAARQWHLALTGVHTHPIHVSGPEINERFETIETLAKLASKTAQPLKQDFLSPSYRRRMIPVLAKRALARLVE